jgi:hypothetical protein
MSYTGRVKYNSRREKKIRNNRNTKIIFVAILIALVILLFKNRYQLLNTLKLYF